MEINYLIKLIGQIPENSEISYVRGDSKCTFLKVDREAIRLYAKTPEGKNVSFADSFLLDLASRIEPNVPFNTSQLLNNKGSNRAVVDSVIANTSEFYWLSIERAKYTVWIPSHKHTPGELVECTDMALIKDISNVNQLSSPNLELSSPDIVRKSFLHFWKVVDQHGADYEAYIQKFENTINPFIKEDIGLESIFEIIGLNKYQNCINSLCNKYPELKYLSNENGPNGDKYLVYSTHKHYLEFLDILSATKNISLKGNGVDAQIDNKVNAYTYRQFITAIKSKPFLLLAGISGTGKSRIVRELARACWEEGSEEYKAQKPKNFEMIQVKPNWHDSSELIGYVSRINGETYVVGPFLKFMVKAIQDPQTPYFLCLDEMNLAPVEQYFAEYLSIIESRKKNDFDEIETDPIVDYDDTDAYKSLIDQLFTVNDDERALYLTKDKAIGKRLSLPSNLVVVGTVNMDETTFSFSRKVLDRAMTIEMNGVDLYSGLSSRFEKIGKLGNAELVGDAVEGVDVYEEHKNVCDIVLGYLKNVNEVLNNTPFKIAYRTRNEFLLYVVNNLPYNKDADDNDIAESVVIARALDEITSMKILSRIEGDDTKVSKSLLDKLSDTISEGLNAIVGDENTFESTVSLPKLEEMKTRLESGYTSFWS